MYVMLETSQACVRNFILIPILMLISRDIVYRVGVDIYIQYIILYSVNMTFRIASHYLELAI